MSSPWIARVWAEFKAGNLTRAYRDCLLTLRTFQGRDGALWPSHATLADRARTSSKTVQRALAAARDIGLVAWSERRVRRGWRWLRTSNAYRLILPDAPVSTNGHRVLRGEQKVKKEVANAGHGAVMRAMVLEAAAMPDLLALRRQAMEARLRKAG